MKKSSLFGMVFVAALFTNNVQSQNISGLKQEFRAPIKATAVITAPNMLNYSNKMAAQPPTSAVFLMNIPLTASQKTMLRTFKMPTLNSLSANISETSPSLPSRIELGMNSAPVLDQGMHGTCVTFATTAALNALIDKNDYVSQLCSLELGGYLQSRSYLPSGWDGSFGALVLDRFREFGIVSMTKQITNSCAGVNAYPLSDMDNTGTPMTLEEYAQLSEDFNLDFYWYSILTPYERFTPGWSATNNDEKILNRVKTALASKNAKANLRLTFGALLPVNHCSAGACATYHKTNDTWAITNAIRIDQDLEFGGHEMVITGYDDTATIKDNEGNSHKGLLILRNSWGTAHGDNGNYYMTYDFFKQFVMEVQQIAKYDDE